jgi:hypothetical protein
MAVCPRIPCLSVPEFPEFPVWLSVPEFPLCLSVPELSVCPSVPILLLHPQKQQLGDPLGGPHDVGRPHGLIGGDHDEVRDPVLGGGYGQVVCAEDVVLDGLEDVRLHQRDVLVGRGVIDDRW